MNTVESMKKLWLINTMLAILGISACSEQTEPQANDDKIPEESLPVYPAPDRTTIPAFPGAEGAGKFTTGGAEGTVYVVTSLKDDGSEGTLRWAIEKSGKRTVVFAVGGVIALTKQLVIKNDDITIAGQTAPGAGICLKNYTLRVNANNVIIRFIRCRMGDECKTEDDSMNGYQSSYPGKKNIIIDHCSMSWSTDECASFYGNTNMTMQWCIVSESLTNSIHVKGGHGYGGLWGGSPATFHHNLLAHHSNRKIPEESLPVYPAPDRTTIPAFPGAEGAGKFTTGGAEGTVYVVTSLKDDGSEGTLRWAIEKSGKRTVVFAVGGVIALTKQLVIKNDDITIAGQTAPGAGICLKNYTLRVNANNVIIRFIRCRMGDECKTEDDSMNGYQSSYPGKKNIIIDHCSMSWSTDECASFYGNTNMTMQWCIVSESLTNSIHVKGGHGYGGLWGGSPATFHHNLLAHHSNRTPRLCGSRYSNRADVEQVDLCNNVIYNWSSEGAYGAQGGSYNIMNNYYKPGPIAASKKVHCRFFTAYVDDGANNQAAGVYGKFYLSGNYMDTRSDLSESQLAEAEAANSDNTSSTAFVVKNNEISAQNMLVAKRFDILSDYSFMQSAQDAYEDVLKYAGVSNKRDLVDTRIVNEPRTGTYSREGSNGSSYGFIDTQKDAEGWDEYVEVHSSEVDSDGDGMPDIWEEQNGLNPADKSDAVKYNLSKDYTNLEIYINSLVEGLYPTLK
jgi:hypothetical protein